MMRIERSIVWISVTVGLLALVTGSAFAQRSSTGIYYDYAQLILGEATRTVLIPRETDAFYQNAPLNVTIPAAFRVLRENKRATYGNTSLTLTDDDIALGRVRVHIDPTQRDWFLIIAAEVVYTFTELGVREVLFPGVTNDPWTRRDVPFPAYVLHAPLWRAIPPGPVTVGLIELPDGTSMSADELRYLWEEQDEDLLDQLFGYLAEGSLVEQTGVLTLLADLDLPGTTEAVLPLLNEGDDTIRLMAIHLLSQDADRRVLARLAELTETDESEEIRAAAAAALGRSDDVRFQYYELLHQLETAAEADQPVIIAELGATGDGRAVQPLTAYVSSPNRTVRSATIEALQQLGAQDELFSLLENEETPIYTRIQLAEALSESTTGSRRIRALQHLARLRDGQSANEVLGILAETAEQRESDEAIAALQRLLDHTDPNVRAEAARLLGRLGDSDSLGALARAARSEEDPIVNEVLMESAAELLVNEQVSEVRDQAESTDPFIQQSAYLALGRMAQSGRGSAVVRRTLTEGLQSSSAEIRAAAVLGLAGFADDQAYNAIEPMASDSTTQVRRAVARALGRFPLEMGREILIGFLQDSEDTVIAATLEAFGRRSEPDVLPEVLGLMTMSRSPEVRALGATAVGNLSTAQSAQVVIDALMGLTVDPEPMVRSAAAGSLGHFDNELAVIGLSTLTQDSDRQVRLSAVEALGRTHHEAAVGVLSTLLAEPSSDCRVAVYRALRELGRPEAVEIITEALEREEDDEARQAAGEAIERLCE